MKINIEILNGRGTIEWEASLNIGYGDGYKELKVSNVNYIRLPVKSQSGMLSSPAVTDLSNM